MWKVALGGENTAAVVSVLAVLVGAGACLSGGGDDKDDDSGDSGYYGGWYDSGWGGGGSGSGSDGDPVELGDATGAQAVKIQEFGCEMVLLLAGAYTGDGTTYKWDTVLSLNASTTCPYSGDTIGTFEFTGGIGYFEDVYVGAATYSGSSVSWATIGYVVGGGGGYSYHYSGYLTW